MKYIVMVTLFMVGCAENPRPSCTPNAHCDRTDRVMYKDTGRVR